MFKLHRNWPPDEGMAIGKGMELYGGGGRRGEGAAWGDRPRIKAGVPPFPLAHFCAMSVRNKVNNG